MEYPYWLDASLGLYIPYDQMMKRQRDRFYGTDIFERRTTMENKKETLREKIDRFLKMYNSCVDDNGNGCGILEENLFDEGCSAYRVNKYALADVRRSFEKGLPASVKTIYDMAIDVGTSDENGYRGQRDIDTSYVFICPGFWRLICEIQSKLNQTYRTEDTEVDPLDKMLEEVLEIDACCTGANISSACPAGSNGCYNCWVDARIYESVIEKFRNKQPMSITERFAFKRPKSLYDAFRTPGSTFLICRDYVEKILALDDMLRDGTSNYACSEVREACEGCSACTDEQIRKLTEKVWELDAHCSSENREFDPGDCPGTEIAGYTGHCARYVARDAYREAITSLLNGEPMGDDIRDRFLRPVNRWKDNHISLCTPYVDAILELDKLLSAKKGEKTELQEVKEDLLNALKEIEKAVNSVCEEVRSDTESLRNAIHWH